MNRRTIAITLSAAALTITSGLLLAGPLDPPPGAVASTLKTLTEVEPRIAISLANTPGDADSLFKITQPGSYYLTGNVDGVIAKHGIEVTASSVTIDLRGFRLAGVAGSLDGIRATTTVANVSVINGTITLWGGDGLNLSPVSGANEDHGLLDAVHSSANGGRGFRIGTNAVVTRCTAADNGGDGFLMTASVVVENCNATNNMGNGFSSGIGCVFRGCHAARNVLSGFSVSSATVLEGCVAILQGAHGFTASSISRVNFTNCRGDNNTGDGFNFGQAILLNCVADANTNSGFHSIGTGSRIEGCTASSNVRGFDIDSNASILVRNTARGNTTANYDIAANNYYGPIISRVGAAAAAVVGNTAASTLTTADPSANFAY